MNPNDLKTDTLHNAQKRIGAFENFKLGPDCNDVLLHMDETERK